MADEADDQAPRKGKGGRPVSIEKQRKIAAVVEMNADGKKKREICDALGISGAEHDKYLSEGRRIYITQPTQAAATEATNRHIGRLEALVEVLEEKALQGKLFSVDRYLQALDRLAKVTGVNAEDRARNVLPADRGAEIDRWLAGSVQAGQDADDIEADILSRVIEENDDFVPDDISQLEQDMDSPEVPIAPRARNGRGR